MNYQQTIDFLFTSLPMFQRIGDAAVKKDLINIRKLCSLLEEPQLAFRSIHIAGTNGKGSTSHMLAAIFQAAGYKTGLYTSPHYVDFRERIRVNGEMISEMDVVRFVDKYRTQWQEIQPSFFEISVAMAFDHFRNQEIEMAIIETGLGGRLDSTNIIQPMLSVITNISYDHMQMLGNSLREIAAEKAGIIKQQIPVVIGAKHEETKTVFIQKAIEADAPIFFTEEHLFVEKTENNDGIDVYDISMHGRTWLKGIKTDMTGPYQQKNLATVAASIFYWNEYYPEFHINDEAIRFGLSNVRGATQMIGRWMIIRQSPAVITDAAHNVDGIQQILPALLDFPAAQKHFVLGFVADKDVGKILSLFPNDGTYYWCSPDIPRGKPADETKISGELFGLRGKSYASVQAAYEEALSAAECEDLVFVGGSSYVVGDFLAFLQPEKRKA